MGALFHGNLPSLLGDVAGRLLVSPSPLGCGHAGLLPPLPPTICDRLFENFINKPGAVAGTFRGGASGEGGFVFRIAVMSPDPDHCLLGRAAQPSL